MRMRTVKPEFWKDDLVARWPLQTRLVYIGLWSEADDFGRLRWNSDYLRSQIFSYDMKLNIKKDLDRIQQDKRVFLYTVSGMPYAVLVNFHKHQRINRKSLPVLPDPPKAELEKFIEGSLRAHGVLTEGSVSTHFYYSEGSVRAHEKKRQEQGTGNREQGTGLPVVPPEGDTGRWLHGKLLETGKFPNLTFEAVHQVCQGFKDCGRSKWVALINEAESLPASAVGSPCLWIAKVLQRLTLPDDVKKNRPENDDAPPFTRAPFRSPQ